MKVLLCLAMETGFIHKAMESLLNNLRREIKPTCYFRTITPMAVLENFGYSSGCFGFKHQEQMDKI